MSDKPKFTVLNQPSYKDHSGHDISAGLVEFLAPYLYVTDGFYKWQCGSCGRIHESRAGWAIAGQVFACESCRKLSLLVKTNVEELDKCFGQKNELEHREKEVAAKEAKLAEYVHRDTWGAIVALLKKVAEHSRQFNNEIWNLTQNLDTGEEK